MSLLTGAGLVGIAGCLTDTDSTPEGGDSTSASGEDDTDSGSRSGGEITVGWYEQNIDNLDPHYVTNGEHFQVVPNICSGLTMMTPEVELQGDLAENWSVEADGARIVYNLREDVRFHNGDQFTADDVAFSIERSVSEEAPNSDLIAPLKPIDDGGVVVVDEYTVEVEFEEPFIPGLIYLSREGRAANIINQRALEEMGREDFQRTPVGTGPFEVTAHDVGERIVLEAFDEYYRTDDGNQLPYLDRIEIRPIPEAGTISNALQSGDVDFINEVPLENASRIRDDSDLVTHERPDLNFYTLSMNTEVEPFDSRTARRGITKLIDSEQLVEEGFFGNANAEPTLFTPALEWVYRDWEEKAQDQAYDPDEGMRLLREAGAEDASITLLADNRTLRLIEIIQRQLSEAGLDVDIDQVSTSVYWDRVGEADAVVTWSSGDYDPDVGIYRNFRSDGAWNDTRWGDSRIDELLDAQRTAADRDERRDMLWEIEDTLIREAPVAFLMHREDVVGHRAHLDGFVHVPFQRRLEYLYRTD
ncbi:ABC transporter substrate-binding protein [Natrarchaeobius sp. A-rgal3]|uniref:ABC transporter substrate-binding protein n=1 Tax=Natrarchaeobius versutus TaxID=1679078 RepID=UPI00350F6F70